MNYDSIPQAEQKEFIATFWSMLRECEQTADNNNDALLKLWVEGAYRQWNRVTGSSLDPVWVGRKRDVSEFADTLKLPKPLTYDQKKLLNTEYGL